MPRVPTTARKHAYNEDSDGPENQDQDQQDDGTPSKKKKQERDFLTQAKKRLQDHLVSASGLHTLTEISRSPKTEEEKRETLRHLAILRSTYTYEECAASFGVSRAQIGIWLADPLYEQVCQEIQQQTRMQGFVTVGSLVNDSLATLYGLMQSDPSGFVRFKCAELLLRHAGMEQPQSFSTQDDKTEVTRFLDQLRQRNPHQSNQNATANVSVQISLSTPNNGIDANTPVIVDSVDEHPTEQQESLLSLFDLQSLASQQQAMLAEYNEPLLPGGKLPGSQDRLPRPATKKTLGDGDGDETATMK